MLNEKYTFTAEVTVWNTDKAAWHLVRLPKSMSAEINDIFADSKRGFGSIKVEATIGSTTWGTSIFPDSEAKAFILFIKADVRKAEQIGEGSKVSVQIKIKT